MSNNVRVRCETTANFTTTATATSTRPSKRLMVRCVLFNDLTVVGPCALRADSLRDEPTYRHEMFEPCGAHDKELARTNVRWVACMRKVARRRHT
jgi:hypothetical protein